MEYVGKGVRRLPVVYLVLLAVAGVFPAAAGRLDRFALVLEDAPVAARIESRKDLARSAATDALGRIRTAQDALRQALRERKIRVTGAAQTLVNAVFVAADESRIEELRALPGVVRVERMLPIKRQLDRAVELIGAPAAWNTLGGIQNAGAGVKIGILDTGIDQTHPAFQDSSLRAPAGYPKCQQPDCAYTNNKVIVARSYVETLVYGEMPEYSRPDDVSPRDRVGHGTAAAAVAAASRITAPVATISGVAPKAFLGNYKIYGSPGVNDVTFNDVVVQALEDAFLDGMDIVNLSSGSPALFTQDDRGTICSKAAGVACDVQVEAVENAVRSGMTVVVSGGNSGDFGGQLPTLNTIYTPGTAPGAITVGATTNSHIYYASVQLPGSDTPADLRRILALFGNGPKPAQPFTAPLRDVSKLDDDGKACSALTNGSLNGAIALILRGDCGFVTKVANAQKAGAAGVVLYQAEGNSIFPPYGLEESGIPAVLIGNRDGQSLKVFLATRTDRPVTLDATLKAENAPADEVAFFSSQGPNIGTGGIKPELVAVGTDLYMPTQYFDPNGDMYDPGRYTNTQGTSFAAPMVAGAVALVKQRNPSWGAAQLKSAVVNTAVSQKLVDYDYSGTAVAARVTAVGAGKLNAADAVRANVTVNPSTLDFGVIGTGALPAIGLRITNNSNAALQLSVQPRDTGGNARVTLSASSAPAGQTTQITARLEGTRPAPGQYEGAVVVRGGAVDLRVPYLYLVGDGVAFNIFPLRGYEFEGNVNELLGTLWFKVVDRYGVPVAGLPVRFRVTLGGGKIELADERTDEIGIGVAKASLGAQLGEQEFTAEAGGLTVYFNGRARLVPTIETNGVVNAASQRTGQGLAPGSYISIFGRGLAGATRVFSTPYLPLSLAGVSVSFDVPARKLSLPGRIHFVSDGQINVQIPWELQGLNSAIMKVSIGESSSALWDVPLNDYSPAFFEYAEASSGRSLAAGLDESYRLIGTGNAVRRGGIAQLYVNGLGPVDNPPPSGEPSPVSPLARTRLMPTVTVGGREAQVSFSGLAPYFVGLYQLNVTVPADTPAGIQPIVISSNGVVSKTANLPIQ
ncbi:MAG: S8 family serine peptidase [Bryobacterales bacterium]|nr:S8 family serine peptidase [Bryobacterales bacterium]